MAYKNNLNFGAKKKNKFLGVCIGVTIIGAGLTIGLLGGHVYLVTGINKNTTNIETISQSRESLKTEVEAVKKQQQQLQKELETVEDSLAKYQPVIIPDSMKNN